MPAPLSPRRIGIGFEPHSCGAPSSYARPRTRSHAHDSDHAVGDGASTRAIGEVVMNRRRSPDGTLPHATDRHDGIAIDRRRLFGLASGLGMTTLASHLAF